MIRKLILAVILILLNTGLCLAQNNFVEGYVVTHSGDTLKGLIDNKEPDYTVDAVNFRGEDGAEAIFRPEDITGFFFPGREYYESYSVSMDLSPVKITELAQSDIRRIVPDTVVFLQLLVKGMASLYFLMDRNEKEHFYIRKDSDTLTELQIKYFLRRSSEYSSRNTNVLIRQENYKGQLSLLLNDCNEVKSLITSTPYERDPLMKLIKKYNECTGNPALVLATMKLVPRFRIGLGVAPTLTTLSLDGYESIEKNEIDFSSSIGYYGGVSLHLVLPRKLGKWSVVNEIGYKAYKSSGSATKPGNFPYKYDYNFYFDLGYLKLYTMMKYMYTGWKVKPFLQAGMSNGYALKKTNTLTKRTYSSYSSETTTGDIFEGDAFRSYEFGVVGCVGAEYHHLGLEVRYEWSNGVSGALGIPMDVNTWFFILSYTFSNP